MSHNHQGQCSPSAYSTKYQYKSNKFESPNCRFICSHAAPRQRLLSNQSHEESACHQRHWQRTHHRRKPRHHFLSLQKVWVFWAVQATRKRDCFGESVRISSLSSHKHPQMLATALLSPLQQIVSCSASDNSRWGSAAAGNGRNIWIYQQALLQGVTLHDRQELDSGRHRSLLRNVHSRTNRLRFQQMGKHH